MRFHLAEKAKNTAVVTGLLVCLLAPLTDEDHDWHESLTDKPGGPHRYTNRTRNIKHVPTAYGRRNKRAREIIRHAKPYTTVFKREINLFTLLPNMA